MKASGQTRSTVRAISIIGGMVRRAFIMPPGPVVSWPMMPYLSGMLSSR